MDVRILREEERFGSWMTKGGLEETGQKWSVQLDGLGDRVASELKCQIHLSLPAGEWAGYLFFLNLYLLLHQTDVKAHTSKRHYKE